MELFFGDAEPLYILASNVQHRAAKLWISQKSSLGPGPIRGPDLSVFVFQGRFLPKKSIKKNSISVYQDY